ncbi:hypothetical protein ACO9S2_09410 [Nitrospira sp. NS4]|uniref:hypothetical protein n=1 Tax=Nitrospira sp. NS4 TaxID=3414498 RepID=UPI003C2B663C
MQHHIKTVEDLRWLMAHTGGFRSGYVTDVQMSKRRLFDEETGRDVLADTTVTVTIRYQLRGMVRVAKLVMSGVTDFSIFEQEGADCSSLSIIQAECTAGRLRFWFDPQGELYAVCEEAHLEEVAAPLLPVHPLPELARWTFQGHSSDGPTVSWLLTELEQAGIPCSWVAAKKRRASDSLMRWEGDLTPDSESGDDRSRAVRVMVYGSLDGEGFGIVLRALGEQDRRVSRVLAVLADRITQRYSGTCLVGTTMIPGREWEYWRARNGRAPE